MTHIISPTLTNRQRGLLLGTIIGGSSLVKPIGSRNCYLAMRNKDIRWLRFKTTELASLASAHPFTEDATNRWHSKCYPLFNQMREELYQNGRRDLKMECLDPLTDIGYMTWFGDSGAYCNGRITLNTHIWGENGSKVIVEYFYNVGYQAEVVKERDKFRVVLDHCSSNSFLQLAEPHLPIWFMEKGSG